MNFRSLCWQPPRQVISQLATLCCCALLASGAQALGEERMPEGFEPLVIGGETILESKGLSEQRSVFVSLPAGYEGSSARYPVIYLLDGRSNFGHVVGTTQIESLDGGIPPVIVVGVNNTRRTRDLTPAWKGVEDDQGRPGRLGEHGGAASFRRFLVEELKPWVDKEFRTAPYSVLIGHSFGGLFAIDTWLEAPKSFDAYVAIAPSLWWDGRRLVDRVEEPKTLRSARPPLYATMGDERPEMEQAYREFEQALAQSLPAASRTAVEHRPGETHGSLVLGGMREGIRFAFPIWRLSDRARRSGDLAVIDRHFDRMSKIYGFPLSATEGMLNQQGYRLMAQGDFDRAIEVLEAAVDRFPDSPNVYDSLGEARRDAGDLEAARRLFQEAVRRAEAVGHPALEDYREHLESLETP